MVKLTTREYILDLISKNPNWNVLDLGCGADGLRMAQVWADTVDHSDKYPPGTFFQTDACDTPFEDGEFDFVFSSHVAEHVSDPLAYCKELVRIGKRGYIEVPTPLFDNLVLGNFDPSPAGHIWWVTYDIIEEKISFRPRCQVMHPYLTPADTTIIDPFFRNCMVTELYWDSSIELRIGRWHSELLQCQAGHMMRSPDPAWPLLDIHCNRTISRSIALHWGGLNGEFADQPVEMEKKWIPLDDIDLHKK
jgi:SAM-dependent methyltransferase